MFTPQEQIIVDRFINEISLEYPLFDFEICKLQTKEEIDKWVGKGMSEVYENSDCYVLKHKNTKKGCYDHAESLNRLISLVLKNEDFTNLKNLHDCYAMEKQVQLEHRFLGIPYIDTTTPSNMMDTLIENWRKNK